MLRVNRFTINFEQACQAALVLFQPNCAINGRFFHFSQCFYQKVQEVGLQAAYINNENNICSFVRKLSALALVPVAAVCPLFAALRDAAPAGVDALLEYFEEQWLNWWPPATWNIFGLNGRKTNNHIEGWHDSLNLCFNATHPNIFNFIAEIKKIERKYHLRLLQCMNGANLPRRNQKYANISNRLNNLKRMFERGDITVAELLERSSHLTGL